MLLTIFNHNGSLMIGYMIAIMMIAIFGVMPQFKRNRNYGLNLYGVALLTFLLSLYPIQSGDFIYVAYALQKGIQFEHLEEIYQNIWLWEKDYTIWRGIVFGATTVLLILTIKLLPLNQYFACFIFVITEMFMFGNLRNMFGFMTMYCSIAIYYYPVKFPFKIVTAIIAILGLSLAIPLHRSMWMYELLLIVGLIPFGKKTIRVSLIAFPFLWTSIFILAQIFLATFANADIIAHSEYYTDSERPTTLLKTINEFIRQCCYLYLFYLILKNYTQKNNKLPSVIKFLTRYAFVLIYIGLLFCGQRTGGWLYERFIGAGELSLMFVMMFFFYHYPRTKGVKIAFSGLIYYLLYQIIYISTYASDNFISRFNTITL